MPWAALRSHRAAYLLLCCVQYALICVPGKAVTLASPRHHALPSYSKWVHLLMAVWQVDGCMSTTCLVMQGMQKPSVVMRSGQQSSSPSSQQTTQPRKATAGPFMRHRQSSRLANRFQRQADYGAENNVAEEFEDWRATRARLKTQQS